MFRMLHGRSPTQLNRRVYDFKTFEKFLDLLRSWYNLRDKQARSFTEWHYMSLTTSVEDKPDTFQMTVARNVVLRFLHMQQQLQEDYRTDRYFRDRVMSEIYIPQIRHAR